MRPFSSTGWCFGFKLHPAINEFDGIPGFYLTAANADEREPTHWITQSKSPLIKFGAKVCFAFLNQSATSLLTFAIFQPLNFWSKILAHSVSKVSFCALIGAKLNSKTDRLNNMYFFHRLSF